MPLAIKADQSLASLTSLRLGGSARHFARVETAADLADAVEFARRRDLGIAILGGGSNILVPDSGVDGLVLEIDFRGRQIEIDGSLVHLRIAAGEDWDETVDWTVAEGWQGLECLSGIPGLVGATPIQNVGAYGAEIADCLRAVEVVDLASWPLETHRLAASECGFSYRNSRFKRSPGRFVITAVELELKTEPDAAIRYEQLRRALGGERADLGSIRRSVLELRRSKGMVLDDPEEADQRSVGSFFLNPVVSAERFDEIVSRLVREGRMDLAAEIPSWPAVDGKKLSAAWLIEASGMKKGMRRGGVGISSRHSLALIHVKNGTTAELLDLACEIADKVDDEFGIRLNREPRHLEPNQAWCGNPRSGERP